MDLPSSGGEAGTEGIDESMTGPAPEEGGPSIGPDPRSGPDPVRERTTPTTSLWHRSRMLAPLALSLFSAVAAVAWSRHLGSEAPGPTLAGDDTPSVVAGEPSPAMLAAVQQVTPGSTEGDRVIAVAPTADGSTAVGVAALADAVSAAGAGSTTSAPSGTTARTGVTARTGAGAGSETEATALPSAGTTGTVAVETASGATAEAAVPRPPDRPVRAFPVNRANRLSTAAVVDLVEANDITNVADFLSVLPPFMGESYVLMEESRSRHQASTEYPRLIMYGPDARMLIGVSSHPLDPLREVVELAELDERTGLWRFSQLDFRNTFVHDTSTESCAGCHGSPQRPIWGEYPNWPGAFAGQDEGLSGGQVRSLMALKADPIDRFHTIAFPSDHSITNNGQLYLPTRQYGYANTSFNFELNAAVADGLARRIIGHPDWASDGHRLMAMQWGCGGSDTPAARDALYNRFGLDGNNDFQLESPVFEAAAGQRDEYDWNQGSTGLDRSVAFRTLDLAARQDRGLAAIVEGDRLFVDLSNAWFDVLGAERAAFLRSNGIYEIDFRPQNLGGGFVSQVCAHLESKGS